ncbi:uncharacterized protein LOC111264125 isoform X3 [Varroa jacobsoni]|uniref:uncharacterized protein LOC111264125 isoform X3 n=1 Tax=Varroa jacobsoni TaxID=62625 RepID=UPI000BF6E43E|nr:uncharacterized protein LOC111264125 isoform X3 [Varroa jacobsoni]
MYLMSDRCLCHSAKQGPQGARGRSVLICNFQTRFCLNGMDFIAAVIYPDDSNLIVYTFDYVTVLVKRRNDFRKCLSLFNAFDFLFPRISSGNHHRSVAMGKTLGTTTNLHGVYWPSWTETWVTYAHFHFGYILGIKKLSL